MIKPGDRLHFVGIGGIGMSGLAQMCRAAGCRVTGSDRGSHLPENRRILDKLELQDITIYPQDGSFAAAGPVDFLVYSTAVEEGNPDFTAAPDTPRLHRSIALAQAIKLENAANTVAVTGSCGKSTVTAYLAEALVNLGEDPACLNGALVNRFAHGRFAGNYRTGSGRYFVFEADESDKSLVNYEPDYAIVLNIATDHYPKEELARVFAEFLNKVRKGAVLEREVYDAVKPMLKSDLKVVVFESKVGGRGDYAVDSYRRVTMTDAIYVSGRRAALAPSGDRVASDADGANNLMRIYGMSHEDCRIESNVPLAVFTNGASVILPQPGMHMALNALAISAMLEMLGFERGAACGSLERFGGVWRRFDFHGLTAAGAKVYDDYAHNPEKIASALRAGQEVSDGAVYAVFQPHGYGPLGFMRDELYEELRKTLRRNDVFIMLEPYYAGGTSSFKPTSAEVAAEYRERDTKGTILHFPDRETLTDYLLLKPKAGEVVMIMGARDNSLSDFAASLTKK